MDFLALSGVNWQSFSYLGEEYGLSVVKPLISTLLQFKELEDGTFLCN